ncbi:MAG TPA: GNAT family N-acetyltransferase, partial [Mycobacterium sp.]|nr:GNAT family N-acetyltransferase [Mycobacterium sp.]
SDPEVTRYLAWPPHRGVEETRAVIAGLFNVGGDRTWLITLRDGDELVGQIGYFHTAPYAVQCGYALGRRYWGRGLAGEALQLVVDHLRSDPALYRAAASVHPDNARSMRVLERAGFTLEARQARAQLFPNLAPEPQDALLYGMALR